MRLSRRALTLVAVALAVAAAGIPLLRLHAALHDAHPVGDYAVFEVNVRMALAGVQRFGPYSQGFHHPGPAYFAYWLAVPYALSGGNSFSLYLGAYALSILFIAASAFAVRRFTSNPVAALALVPFVGLELSYLGDFPLFDYWPPYVLFLGYVLFLLLAAGVSSGRLAAFAPLVAVGSFLIQTHVSYGLPVLAGGGVAFGYLFGERARLPSLRKHALLGMVTLVLFWGMPVYAEVFEGAGNLRRIHETFFEGSPVAWQMRALLDRVALEFTGPFQAALFGDKFIVPDGPKHVIAARMICVLLLWAVAAGWRRARAEGDRFLERLCAVCFVSLPVAAFALTRIRGSVAPHHTAFISVIGMVSAVAVAGCFGGRGPFRGGGTGARTPGPAVVDVMIAAAFALLTLVHPVSIIAGVHRNPEVEVLASAISDLGREPGVTGLQVRWGASAAPGGQRSSALELALGVLLDLEKRGVPFSVRPTPAVRLALGRPHWDEMGTPSEARVLLTAGDDGPFGGRLACVYGGENYFTPYPVCAWREK